MSTSQPDHDSSLQEFQQLMDEARVMGSDASLALNRPFIPTPKLQTYFRDLRHIQQLLEALFAESERTIHPEEIQRNYSIVFSILLLIGKGRYIKCFVRHDHLRDQYLPFKSKPTSFPKASADVDFFDSFRKQQWEFCARTFEENMDKHFDAEEVLPIINMKLLAGGVSAKTFQIILHESYNRLRPRGIKTGAVKYRNNNTFVLKSYRTRDAEEYYTNEVSAFRKFWDAGEEVSIIGFHGSFVQNGSYNLVLEHADRGSLEDYFHTAPPYSEDDIIKFWRGLFGVLHGLELIHETPSGDQVGPQIFQGWHQDIKPANILVKSVPPGSSYDCQFKLGDLGSSHFRKQVPTQQEDTHRDSWGTRTYGAPECYRFDGPTENSAKYVKQNVDIWSLGCVFSEAAVWVVRGWDGLQEYRRRRTKATDSITNFKGGDYFHDGENVLPIVAHILRILPEHRRPSDHITANAEFLSMVMSMLENPKGRPAAPVLYYRSQKIINAATHELGSAAQRHLLLGDMHSGGSSMGALHMQARPPLEEPPNHPQPYSMIPRHSTSYTSSPDEMIEVQNNVSLAGLGSTPFPRRSSGLQNDYGYHPYRPSQSAGPEAQEYKEKLGTTDTLLHLRQGPDNRDTSRGNGRYPQIPYEAQSPTRAVTLPTAPTHNARFSMYEPTEYQHGGRHDESAYPSATAVRSDTTTTNRGLYPGVQDTQHSQLYHSSSPYEAPLSAESPRNTPVTPPSQEAAERRPIPLLSLESVSKWKHCKKSFLKSAVPLTDEYLLSTLEKRDHVFLIDNSASMRQHRKEVRDLLEHLVYMVKDSDPDGVELISWMSKIKQRFRHTTGLLDAFDKMRFEGESNIRAPLLEILKDYQTKLQNGGTSGNRWSMSSRPVQVRPQNVYIFTDAIWQPACEAGGIIRGMVVMLERYGVHKEDFGIQFIRFGDDPTGIARLNHLDAGLGLSMDIVDHEPAKDGNIWKMLLGPTNQWFDNDTTKNDSFSNPSLQASNGYAPAAIIERNGFR